MIDLNPAERTLLGAVTLLLACALLGPAAAQPAHQHAFADQRAWLGLAQAADVLSNAPFALWGLIGLVQLCRGGDRSNSLPRGLLALFFSGLLLTAAASSFYHWRPVDTGLAIDRLGMAVAFAGLLGLAAAERASQRAGWALAALVLVTGPLSVAVWLASGNVLPWLALQLGGMALILCLAARRPPPGSVGVMGTVTVTVNWAAVIAIYALAKVLEAADHPLYALTGQLVSGHSLKHVVASCAAWPVLVAMAHSAKGRKWTLKSGQNPRQGFGADPAVRHPAAITDNNVAPRSPA